jgi:GT2 family glycosyltransferase
MLQLDRPPLHVCIATWELKPFTGGGIGTLVYNLLKTYGNDLDSKLSILWYGDRSLTEQTFLRIFPHCRFFSAREWARAEGLDAESPPERAFALDRHWQSFELMRALRNIERRLAPFDVVEFPDFAGAASVTLQEKLLGRAFQKTTIAVRIHSTEAALRRSDHRPADWRNLFVADMERKAVADADVVVGHLSPVIDDLASYLRLPDQWLAKCVIEEPPVLVDAAVAERACTFEENTPLLFTSKVQWFKRPHVFVNAAVAFMRAQPDYKGEALLLAQVIDNELRHHCEHLIPADLRQRIRIVDNSSNPLRDSLIRKSITVFPSAHESYCLAAHEASKLGAIVLLNRSNPAFGPNTPWMPGGNCETFDGTAEDLSNLLQDLWLRRRSIGYDTVASVPPIAPYWQRITLNTPSSQISQFRESLTLIVPVSEGLGDPLDTVRSAVLADQLDVDVILVCEPLPYATERSAILERIKTSTLASEGRLKILNLGFNAGLAALCNRGLREAETKYVAFARAGASMDARFLSDSVKALEAQPLYDLVVPQVVYEDGSATSEKSVYVDKVCIGEALNSGVVHNLLGPIEMVARRSAIAAVGFDETLDRYVDWDFHLRACAAGHRYIVSNRVEVRLDIEPNTRQAFRSHLDSVLVKHSAALGGGRVPLVAAYDAQTIMELPHDDEAKSTSGAARKLFFAKRPISYYLWEKRPWWRIALRHPTKPLRWLMLREIQTKRL